MTSPEYFTRFEPQSPQYRVLTNDTITSLTLKITDQNNNIITDGLKVTVVLHIKYNPLLTLFSMGGIMPPPPYSFPQYFRNDFS